MKDAQRKIGASTKVKKSIALLTICPLVLVLAGCTTSTHEPPPSNLIGVLIDGSKTFDRRRGDAVERAQQLIEKIAEKPGRRNQGDHDKVVVIAIDAMPSVLWRGTLEELRNSDRAGWIRRFESRSDYSSCTDVEGSFRLAAEELGPSSLQLHKYMFVFSDLQHEPPKNSLSGCFKPLIGPSESFPWDEIQDSSISVFWTPPQQKLAWQRQIDSHGLSKSFHIYVDSESAEIIPAPPPEARRIVTDQERRQTQERLASTLTLGLKLIGVVLGLCLAIIVGLIFVAARRRASRRYASLQSVTQRTGQNY